MVTFKYYIGFVNFDLQKILSTPKSNGWVSILKSYRHTTSALLIWLPKTLTDPCDMNVWLKEGHLKMEVVSFIILKGRWENVFKNLHSPDYYSGHNHNKNLFSLNNFIESKVVDYI